jgi:hypothetical protein
MKTYYIFDMETPNNQDNKNCGHVWLGDGFWDGKTPDDRPTHLNVASVVKKPLVTRTRRKGRLGKQQG